MKVVKIALVLAVLALIVYFFGIHFRVPDISIGSVPAATAPEVTRAPTKRVAIASPVKVFDDKVKFALKLPPAVVKNSADHVIAATQVREALRPQTVTTVIDEKTGESQTFVKADPYPWLAVENRGEVRMAYGYRFTPNGNLPALGTPGNTVKQVGRVMFSYDAVRVKALTGGVTAHVDTDGQAFVGAGVVYRW